VVEAVILAERVILEAQVAVVVQLAVRQLLMKLLDKEIKEEAVLPILLLEVEENLLLAQMQSVLIGVVLEALEQLFLVKPLAEVVAVEMDKTAVQQITLVELVAEVGEEEMVIKELLEPLIQAEVVAEVLGRVEYLVVTVGLAVQD
jgi:hypothetical protein